MKPYYRHFVLIIILALPALNPLLMAQIQYGGRPAAVEYNLPADQVPAKVLSLSTEKAVEARQLAQVDDPGVPLHAGFALPANISPRREGEWQVVNKTLHVWRLRVVVPGALGVGVNFDAFQLTESARLFVYDPAKTTILGAFDHRNNNPDQVFATHVIPGQEIIIEYQEPYAGSGHPVLINALLNIESIIYLSNGGGLKPFVQEKDLGDADTCMVNINCPEGDNWQDQKRGVARILLRKGDRYSWCTGTLINNTALDYRPYFLTAEHCGRDADPYDLLFWQFYFNFERPGCSEEGTPPYNMLVGAEQRAMGFLEGGSDFRLLELQDMPPAHWRPYWNGWDRSNTTSSSGVGIHHPSGDAMKISTYDLEIESSNPLVSGQQMATNSAWRVRWSTTQSGHSVSQGGSSGSPLFSSQGLVIGSLTGGSSSCTNPFFPDYYGKFSYHWNQNGTADNRQLEDWLDPLNTGQLTLGGLDLLHDENPAPGYLTATTDQNQVSLTWYPPGSFPNPEGWYSYVNDYSHLTWQGPERATVFDAPDFGLSYPLTLSAVSHLFVNHSSNPWPDDRFTFKVYDTDGATLLYESPVLNALDRQEVVHELETPLVLDGYFYVAVAPLDASGHPSSLMLLVNLGAGHSFFGQASDWIPYNTDVASYTYVSAIYVEDQQPATKQLAIQPPEVRDIPTTAEEDLQFMDFQQPDPDAYNLYRDAQLIITRQAGEELTYTETLEQPGLYKYQVTALYGETESLPSNTAYVLIPGDCPEVISQWPYQQSFNTGFDNTCWITRSEGDQAALWQLTSSFAWDNQTLQPFDGDQFYVVNPPAEEISDAWLITPTLDFTSLASPALRFAFSGVLLNEQDHLAVRISTDGQSFVNSWDTRLHPDFIPGNQQVEWYEVTVDLAHLAGQSDVRLAFQFMGQGEAFAAVDQIQIVNGQNIRYTLNINVSPEDAGMVTGSGQYLAGEVVILQAHPNAAQIFQGWSQGATQLGEDETILFQMPAQNVTLTALFDDDPLDVTEPPASTQPVQAFPNPTSGSLRLHFNESMANLHLMVLDSQGRMLRQLQLPRVFAGDQQLIDLLPMSPGIYFIRLTSDKHQQTIKVIRTP